MKNRFITSSLIILNLFTYNTIKSNSQEYISCNKAIGLGNNQEAIDIINNDVADLSKETSKNLETLLMYATRFPEHKNLNVISSLINKEKKHRTKR